MSPKSSQWKTPPSHSRHMTPAGLQAQSCSRATGAWDSASVRQSPGRLQEGPLPPAYVGLPSLSLDKQKATAADGPAGLSSQHTHTSSLWLLCQGWAQQRKTKGAWPQDTEPLFFLLKEKPQPKAEGATVFRWKLERLSPVGGCPKKRLSSGQVSCCPNLTTRLHS